MRLRQLREEQSGFTLVEMLVAMLILMAIATVSMSVIKSAGDTLKASSSSQDLNEEARQALNRMARDLRQAKTIVTAVNADGPSFNANGIVAIRAQADFDGDGCIGGTGGDRRPPLKPAEPRKRDHFLRPAGHPPPLDGKHRDRGA